MRLASLLLGADKWQHREEVEMSLDPVRAVQLLCLGRDGPGSVGPGGCEGFQPGAVDTFSSGF